MIEGAGRDKWHADGEGRSLGRQLPVADRAESWPTRRLRVGWPIYRSAGETAWLATSCRASRSSRPQPNESCGAIHNRMPAVLAREVWPLWLGAQDAIRTPRPRLPGPLGHPWLRNMTRPYTGYSIQQTVEQAHALTPRGSVSSGTRPALARDGRGASDRTI